MYPIAYEADFDPAPNRVTTFFRLIVAIPWLIVAYFWGIVAAFTHLFAWVAVIVLGRYPEGLHDLNAGIVRFQIRTYAWLYLQTDEWPPFGIADDQSYPIRVNFAPPAERQSRLQALFRIILLLPLLFVAYAINVVHYGLAFVSWLVIVFRGYQPEGIHQAMTFVNSFYARLYGYWSILTDDYPPIGLERAKGTAQAPLTSPPPPQPPAPPAAPTT